MGTIDASRLIDACADDAADAGIQILTELEPLGGTGAPIKPAVYAGGVYQWDRRWVDTEQGRVPADVIVIDNVPSQANRLEAVLERRRGSLGLPEIVLDLSGVSSLPSHLPRRLSSFRFPHRNADAYLRDAMMDGASFIKSEVGSAIFAASSGAARPLLQWFPQALLYGFWQSHLGKKRSQAKLARSWVSEIVGERPALDGRAPTRIEGLKGDALNLSTDSKVVYDEDDLTDWMFSDEAKTPGKKGGKKTESLSNIGHGQVPIPEQKRAPGGVSFARIVQRATLSLASLRRIHFEDGQDAEGRGLVAALGLLAHPGVSFDLRSGCTLRPTTATWRWLGPGHDEQVEALDSIGAEALFRDCVERAEKAGLPVGSEWPAPLTVTPSDELLKAIRDTWPLEA